MATSTIVLLSDSTNAWFVNTANRQSNMVTELYDRFKVTVKTSECSTLTGAYQALQTTKVGLGSDEIHMYDGAVGGTNWDDYDASAIAARITAVSPDIVLIAYGINGGEAGADGIGAFIDDVQAAAPSATILMLSQNPITSHGPTDTNRDLIQAAAVAESLTFVDVYQAFIDTGDYASYLDGGVHPNAAGQTLYVNAVAPSLSSAISLTPQGVPVGILDSADLVLKAVSYSGTGDLLDESGNGHDATIFNSPTWDGQSFDMNAASSHYMTVADADVLDPDDGPFTVVYVTNPRAGGNGRTLGKRAGGSPYWSCYYSSATPVFSWTVNDGTDTITLASANLSGPPDVSAGNGPYVVSLVFDGSDGSSRYGVDGTYLSSASSAVGTVTSGTDLHINAWLAISQYGEQDFYGLAIWKGTALSDAEIEEAGSALQLSYNVADAATLHGDGLKTWILENVSSGYTSTELVGILNELNGTNGVEYAEARGTFLGVDPAG